MRHCFAFAVLLVALAAGSAGGATGPNPEGMRGPLFPGEPSFPTARATSIARPASVSATQFVPAPLPAGGVQIDSTYYDLQDLGSLGTRIVVGGDGRVHATWEDDFCELDPNGCPPNPGAAIPFPQRGMAYAIRDANGTWTRVGKVRQPTIHCSACPTAAEDGGFGTLALTTNGRAVISQHMMEDGCDLRGDTYIENAAGGSAWTAYLGPVSSPSFQFPQVVALPNGSITMLGEAVRVTENCTHCGVSEFRISRLSAEGAPFTCVTGWQFGNWTTVVPLSMFRNGYPAFPCLASGSDGRVGIAVTDFGTNVFLIESSDGTFAPATVRIRSLTNYSDASITLGDSMSTEYRPSIHCHLAYNDTTPNVVWSELQARRVGGSIAYADWHSKTRHWSSTRGVSTVKQTGPVVADGFSHVLLGGAGPLAGFNTLSVDWPQVGFSSDGTEMYVVWVRFVDAEVDPTADAGLTGICTGIGFGDIEASVARGNLDWSPSQNLTSTPNADERYPALAARNEGGRVHLLLQTSATNQAGIIQAQDRGTSGPLLVRRIVYLDRALNASLVGVDDRVAAGVPRLRVLENPAPGRVRFSLEPQERASAVEVFSVNGRLVVRLPLGRGSVVEWDGGDRSGRMCPSGVYLARLSGSRDARPVKFMLLR